MAFSGVQDKITHHLDVLGFYCPVPLHETKKALQALSVGDVIGVRTDDPETLHDIPMFLDRTKHVLEVSSVPSQYVYEWFPFASATIFCQELLGLLRLPLVGISENVTNKNLSPVSRSNS